MVEVVTQEDFDEFRKSLEEKLDTIDRNIGVLIKDLKEAQRLSKAEIAELNKQIEELSESSRGFVDRLRGALLGGPTEPEASFSATNAVGGPERTIGRVADIIVKCPNFFEWEFCHQNCPMYVLCDEISGVQDTSRLSQMDYFGRLSGAFKRLEGSILSRRRKA